jgi:hypothetical protein
MPSTKTRTISSATPAPQGHSSGREHAVVLGAELGGVSVTGGDEVGVSLGTVVTGTVVAGAFGGAASVTLGAVVVACAGVLGRGCVGRGAAVVDGGSTSTTFAGVEVVAAGSVVGTDTDVATVVSGVVVGAVETEVLTFEPPLRGLRTTARRPPATSSTATVPTSARRRG